MAKKSFPGFSATGALVIAFMVATALFGCATRSAQHAVHAPSALRATERMQLRDNLAAVQADIIAKGTLLCHQPERARTCMGGLPDYVPEFVTAKTVAPKTFADYQTRLTELEDVYRTVAAPLCDAACVEAHGGIQVSDGRINPPKAEPKKPQEPQPSLLIVLPPGSTLVPLLPPDQINAHAETRQPTAYQIINTKKD